jgi:hypothetical protein
LPIEENLNNIKMSSNLIGVQRLLELSAQSLGAGRHFHVNQFILSNKSIRNKKFDEKWV